MNLAFNSNQLATWKAASDLKNQIEDFRTLSGLYMGGGIKEVFIPEWVAGPAGFPEPNDADEHKYFLHFRALNGKVVNVGLILDKIVRFGGNTNYVFWYLNSGDLS